MVGRRKKSVKYSWWILTRSRNFVLNNFPWKRIIHEKSRSWEWEARCGESTIFPSISGTIGRKEKISQIWLIDLDKIQKFCSEQYSVKTHHSREKSPVLWSTYTNFKNHTIHRFLIPNKITAVRRFKFTNSSQSHTSSPQSQSNITDANSCQLNHQMHKNPNHYDTSPSLINSQRVQPRSYNLKQKINWYIRVPYA